MGSARHECRRAAGSVWAWGRGRVGRRLQGDSAPLGGRTTVSHAQSRGPAPNTRWEWLQPGQAAEALASLEPGPASWSSGSWFPECEQQL